MKCKRHGAYWWMRVEDNVLIKCPQWEATIRVCCTCRCLLSLGPANDESEAVKIEIRASEIASITTRYGYTTRVPSDVAPALRAELQRLRGKK